MTSTFTGLEIGKRGVMAHERALQVTGHNLTNAETEGYSRQRVDLATMEPIYLPGLNRAETAGQIGQGAVVSRIERVRDELLDRRIVAQAGGEGYWQTRDPYIRQMDQMYLEVGDNSIRSKLDAFWDAWQELANRPTERAARTAVVERGRTLIDGIHGRFEGLEALREMADGDVALTVERVNELSRQIAALNDEIQKVRAQGDNPNDLYDRRDLLVDKLSSIVPVRVDNQDQDGKTPEEFMVHINGQVLVQGRVGRQFEITRDLGGEGYGSVRWADTGEAYQYKDSSGSAIGSGSLGALLEMRDETIAGEVQTLDNLTMNFIDLVNESHRSGWGANGKTGLDFFSEHHFTTNVMGNYDRNGDGELDSSWVFRVNGTNVLEERAQIGLAGRITLPVSDAGDGRTTVQVPYYAEDTVADVISRINGSGAEVAARLGRDGRLQLKGTPAASANFDEEGLRTNPDFVIRHIEDTDENGGPGLFLADYAGLLNRGAVYDWETADAAAAFVSVADGSMDGFSTAPVAHPSGWIEVNPVLLRDVSSVAAGFGVNGQPANPGNGEAALAIASIRNNSVMVGRLGTFDDYFADATGRIGMLGEQSGRALETQNLVMKQLRDMRSSVSGVNMDEELAAMIKYQHGYAASARFVTTVNSMLDILMRMGA